MEPDPSNGPKKNKNPIMSSSTPTPPPSSSKITSNNETSWSLRQWFSSFSSTSPKNNTNSSSCISDSSCPVLHNSTSSSCPNATPPSIEESAKHPQTPHPDQKLPLSTHRSISSIPRSDQNLPHHQPTTDNNWMYPSEQQFYNAMRRKGYNNVDETTINTIVQIHNAVNERSWNEVCKWETELHGTTPKLIRFMGRPKDASPKALLNQYVLMYNPPFDRHDWFIDRGDGRERRYVIDFYQGGGKERGGVNMYLDVRPALDDVDAGVDRCRMFVREMLPGIFGKDVGLESEKGRGEKK